MSKKRKRLPSANGSRKRNKLFETMAGEVCAEILDACKSYSASQAPCDRFPLIRRARDAAGLRLDARLEIKMEVVP